MRNTIFDNDLAFDIRLDFEEDLEDGYTVKEACDLIMSEYADLLDDEQDGPMIYLALISLQLEYDDVDETLKKHVLKMIKKNKTLELYEDEIEQIKDQLLK